MTAKRPSWVFTGALVVLWFAALVWLGHTQGWWARRTAVFRRAGPGQQCLALRWGSSRVGWVRSERRALPEGGWQILSEARLAVTAVGAAREVAVDGVVIVDQAEALQSFTLDFRVGGYPFTVRGERDGDEFVVREGAAPLWSQRRIAASEAAYLGIADPLLGPGTVLPPGGGTLKFLNPLTLKVERVKIRVLGPDTVMVAGTRMLARLLEVDSFGLRSHCWVDDDGVVVRAKTALGLEAVAAPCDEATGSDLRPVEPMRVTTDGSAPADADRLVARIQLPQELRVENHRQIWRGDTLFSIAEWLPEAGAGDVDSTYVQPGPMVESDHPAILAEARKAVGDERDRWRKAVLILRWVHGYLHRELCPAVPSALGALRSQTGDCTEHAALFVAMCRAVGVPADIRAGVAYVPGHGFGYHAWVAVYTTRWVEMDPTWGQDLVDASHISLVEGTPEEHVDLALAGEELAIRVLDAD
jgi:hypothetical protein